MDYKKEFDKLQKDIQDKKLERARLEERMENLQKDLEQIRGDLKELDVAEDKLDEVVSALEEDIKKELDLCNQTLNK